MPWEQRSLVVTVLVVEAQAAMAEEYHVVRVVDGDTVDVRLGHQGTTRVRLLNVDAPETVDPNSVVECLGPEASQRLKELLPEGSTVDLAFDDERTDRYGRTLAGVYADGVLVNAQLASEGLAVPMTVGSNTRFQAAVEASWEDANEGHLGLFDPNAPCTAPGKVRTLTDDVASLTTAVAPQRASDAAAAAIAAKAVTEDASMLQEYLVAKSASEVAVLPAPMLSSLVKDVRALSRQSAAAYRAMGRLQKSLAAREKARATGWTPDTRAHGATHRAARPGGPADKTTSQRSPRLPDIGDRDPPPRGQSGPEAPVDCARPGLRGARPPWAPGAGPSRRSSRRRSRGPFRSRSSRRRRPGTPLPG